jgi:hypothetical protein
VTSLTTYHIWLTKFGDLPIELYVIKLYRLSTKACLPIPLLVSQ